MKIVLLKMSALGLCIGVLFLATATGGANAAASVRRGAAFAPAQSPPRILNARMKGSKIIIQGENFNADTVVLINGQPVRTVADSQAPSSVLVAKKINKVTPMGAEVQLQVQTSGGLHSDPYAFFVGQTITLEDTGKTITLNVGEKVMLLLKYSNLIWTITVQNPAVLQKIEDPNLVQGAQGIFQAISPGSTRLTAVGDPPCSKLTPPCAQPSFSFEVNILVQ